MQRLRSLSLSLAILAPLTGCIPSNVVAKEERAVVLDGLEDGDWQPMTDDDLSGLWHSIRLEGPLAGSLLSISYWFESDGSFSSAALFLTSPPSFQVLGGDYELTPDGNLRLGEDSEPARAESTPGGLVRLSGEDGTVYLRREEQR